MSTAATFDQIRGNIVAAIRTMSPTYEHYQCARWNPVMAPEDVPSHDLRNFFVELSVPTEVGEIYGGCALHESELLVWTSYGGLSATDQQVIISRDHQDIWRALHRASIDGAPKFTKGGFEEENQDGRLWGAHVFTAELFLPLP